MPTKTVYTPTAGSLPDRVCRYFAANPDEELSVADIALKFECVRGGVCNALQQAVTHGLLQRGHGAGGTTFKAGANLSAPPPPTTVAPPAALPRNSAFDVAKPKRKRVPLPPFDPDAIEIRTGVPVPPPLNHMSARLGSSYLRLIERIPPGGMVELDTPRAKSLMSCAKKKGIKLTTRLLDVDGTRTGVWREA